MTTEHTDAIARKLHRIALCSMTLTLVLLTYHMSLHPPAWFAYVTQHPGSRVSITFLIVVAGVLFAAERVCYVVTKKLAQRVG